MCISEIGMFNLIILVFIVIEVTALIRSGGQTDMANSIKSLNTRVKVQITFCNKLPSIITIIAFLLVGFSFYFFFLFRLY